MRDGERKESLMRKNILILVISFFISVSASYAAQAEEIQVPDNKGQCDRALSISI